jgi:CheY-like chemotaxis protein/ketosteroid isomerase-like protein
MGDPGRAVGAAAAPVLLVEADADLSSAVQDLLTEEGFAVEAVETPEQAIALLGKSYFALVIADYVFGPLERSEQLARELQAAATQVPIGCVTAWAGIPRAVAAHYAFVLQQPIEPEQLLAAVGRFASVQRPDPERSGVIARYFDALGSRDWNAVADLCTSSVRYYLPGADPLSGMIEGRDAFRAYTAETFRAFPEVSFEVTALSWLPHGVVATYRGLWSAGERGTNATNGDVYFQFSGPQIAEIGVRTDLARLRQQMPARA